MVRYYAKRAQEYERIYHKPERAAELRRLRELLEGSFAGADVFELACGTGYWTNVLSRTAHSVLGSDINEEMLAIARNKPWDGDRIQFIREDAYALAPLPQSFNAGLAAFWWSHVPKHRFRAFLHGFHQRIGPNARVMFVDNNFVEGSNTPLARTDADGNTYQKRPLSDGTTHEVLKNFPSEAELRSAVAGIGRDVRVEQLRYYWVLSYIVER